MPRLLLNPARSAGPCSYRRVFAMVGCNRRRAKILHRYKTSSEAVWAAIQVEAKPEALARRALLGKHSSIAA